MEKPLKVKTCSQNFLLPISFLQNIFASQYSLLPPNDFLLAKNSPKILLAKFPPQKNLLLQNMLPKISSQENFFQKKFVPHFAPLIFIQKNLLPKFFLPKICCQTFLLSIFLLIIKFYLQKSSKIFLQAKFPPHKNLSSKTWSQKFPLQKICLFALTRNCSPFCPPPPPPPPPPPKKKFFFHSKEFAPQIFPPKICCQTFLLSILLLTKNCFPNFAPQKSLLSKPLCGAVMAPA